MPPHPWPALVADLGVSLLRADELDSSLSALLATAAG
jgi:hypothetical protein